MSSVHVRNLLPPVEMSFSGKVVIVTGAAGGIGAATAEMFAKEGAKVVPIDLDKDKLCITAEKCAQNGSKVTQIVADVAKDTDAQRIIDEVTNKFGKIDILVNCAGILRYGSILDGNLMKAFDELIGVNLRAVMKLTSLAAPYLIETKGNIVNIASIGAKGIPCPDYAAYSVSKAGVVQFTRASAYELAEFGVRVNCVSPGATKSDIVVNSGRENNWDRWTQATLLKRISEPEEIAHLVLYLASDKAGGITGADFVNDNGTMLM